MRILKRLLVFLLVFSIVLFISSLILEIDLIGYLEREFVRSQYVELQQENNIFNDNFDPEEQSFILFDELCKQYGPFTFSQASRKLQEGLRSECIVEDEDTLSIELHENSYIENEGVINNLSNLIYNYPGFEGDDEDNLRIQVAIYQLPQPFRDILLNDIQVINGCHPYGEALFDRCVYGVFDPVGYGADGKYGNEWKMSIWISDRGIESGNLNDILLHEAAHAYSYQVLRRCMLQNGSSFRSTAHERFGNEENFADAFVHYFGGKWTHYVQRNYLEVDDNKWFTDMIKYCEWYIDCKEQLDSSL